MAVMQATIVVKLQPSSEQHARLLSVMERFNSACGAIAEVAFAERCANRFALQKLAYARIREDFGLSAQMAIRAIAKVCEVYKRDRDIKPTFRPHGAIVYDQRILSWQRDRVSILTLEGRQLLPVVMGTHQRELLGKALRIGQADLVLRSGEFYLHVAVTLPEVAPVDPRGFLGVDLGIKNLAADSDGQVFSGAQVANLRRRHARLRAKLQSKGTNSAKRLLRKRKAKERRFGADVNHRISKQIARKAHDTGRGIALEELEGIRERTTVRRSQRRVHHSWSFRQLRLFIEYKAERLGVPVVAVDPRNTSRTCPECGLVDKRNRPTRNRFCCISCGYAAPADFAAARVISCRAAVMRPDAVGACA